jgi:AraC-like DNA-binding protein
MIQQNQTIEFNGRGLTPRQDSFPGPCRMDGSRGESGPMQKVERSIHYMLANLNRPLQVATLAAHANVSPSHFFALFKQMTGRPPMDYFTKLRMSHACRLLDSNSASVKEVAAALGYNDPFYFSRVFKSVSAVAPVHYRGLGFSSRREIKDLLEPKDQITHGDPLRRGGSGRLSTRSISTQSHLPQQDQPKTTPRT